MCAQSLVVIMVFRSIVLLALAALTAGFVPGALPRTYTPTATSLIVMGNPMEDAMAAISTFFKQVHAKPWHLTF